MSTRTPAYGKKYPENVRRRSRKSKASRAGTNDASNLVIACEACYQKKEGKTMREYWLWQKKLGLPKTGNNKRRIDQPRHFTGHA